MELETIPNIAVILKTFSHRQTLLIYLIISQIWK